MSASGHVNILASTRTNVLRYVSACFSQLVEYAEMSMCWHVCQHLVVLAYMSASGHVNIFVSIRTNLYTHTYIYIYMSLYSSPLAECADTSTCWHVCQHLVVSAYIYICRHWDLSVYLPAQQQMCWYYVGILITTSRMCRHLKVLACMSASWCVGIYVGIWTCQNICRHTNKCGDIYVSIFPTTRIICRHLNAGIYVRILIFRNKCRHLDMSAYLPAQERICWHICRHISHHWLKVSA